MTIMACINKKRPNRDRTQRTNLRRSQKHTVATRPSNRCKISTTAAEHPNKHTPPQDRPQIAMPPFSSRRETMVTEPHPSKDTITNQQAPEYNDAPVQSTSQQPPPHSSAPSQRTQAQSSPAQLTHQESQYRTVTLIVYGEPPPKAHWVLFVPSADNPSVGKIIHVVRVYIDGPFDHEFRRNYDKYVTRRPHNFIPIGQVGGDIIVDVPRGSTRDKTPVDLLEQIALTVPAPGPRLNSALAPVCLNFHPFAYSAH